MIAHFFACAWFFAAKLVEFPPDCWVVRAGARDESPGNLYMISLYWVLTLTTVGYGEILPITNTERYLATFFMIVGVGFCTYAIGTISSILSSSDSSRKRLKVNHILYMKYEIYIGEAHGLRRTSQGGRYDS